MCEQCERKQEDVRWLALLIRQGLKLIIVGIEKRYNLPKDQSNPVKADSKHSAIM